MSAAMEELLCAAGRTAAIQLLDEHGQELKVEVYVPMAPARARQITCFIRLQHNGRRIGSSQHTVRLPQG